MRYVQSRTSGVTGVRIIQDTEVCDVLYVAMNASWNEDPANFALTAFREVRHQKKWPPSIRAGSG